MAFNPHLAITFGRFEMHLEHSTPFRPTFQVAILAACSVVIVAQTGCSMVSEADDRIFAEASPSEANGLTIAANTPIAHDHNALGIDSLAWKPGIDNLAVLSDAGQTVSILKAPNWQVAAQFEASSEGVGYGDPIAFFTEDKIVAEEAVTNSEGASYTLRIRDLRTGHVAATLPTSSGARKLSLRQPLVVASSPTSNRLAVTLTGLTTVSSRPHDVLALYSDNPSSSPRTIAVSKTVEALTFSPDGNTVAIGFNDGSIALIRFDDAVPRAEYNGGAKGSCTALAFSGSGDHLAAGFASESGDHHIEILNVPTGSSVANLKMPVFDYGGRPGTPRISSLSWSKFEDRLAAGSEDAVRVWTNASQSPKILFERHMRKSSTGHLPYGPYKLKFSDSGVLAVGTGNSVTILK